MKATTTQNPNTPFASSSRFAAASGFIVEEVSGTWVHGYVDFSEDHHTPWGVVHGGAYATIVESAASIGASHAVADRGQHAVGVHNSTDFLRPAVAGRAVVDAVALHQGRTQQLWQVVITDETTTKILARGQLRLQNVPDSEGSRAV